MKRIFLLILCLLFISSCSKETPNIQETPKTLNAKSSIFEYGDLVKYEDIFEDNNIIFENKYLDTNTLGDFNTQIKYKKDNDVYTTNFSYTVIDTTKPLIWSEKEYIISTGDDFSILDKIICTDNYDKNPNCYVEGTYSTSKAGIYDLTIKAEDVNNNVESVPVRLIVYNKEKEKNAYVEGDPTAKIYFKDAYKEYKNDHTLVGIDVSGYQKEIDWKKVKEEGVEFAIIRLGYQYFLHSPEMEIDPYFIQNINGALENDIKVGAYFYSFATTTEEAITQANFVIETLKGYNVTMPIAFDWENFEKFNKMKISLTDLRAVSYAYQDTLYNAGYKPVQYGSKSSLNNFWTPVKYDTWVAHYLPFPYTTDYKGKYIMWQICNTGVVNGIDGNIDIDVYYK